MEFTSYRADRPEGYILLGRAFSQQGKFVEALREVDAAKARAPLHPAATLLQIECLLQTGERSRALNLLRQFESDASHNPRLLQDAGSLYSHLNLHIDAERCYARAAARMPHDPQYLYNWATCLIALGRMDEADQQLTRVIAIAPDDYDAYYNRSTLRRQTLEQNHIPQLQSELLRASSNPNACIALGYALAKEFEDIGRYAESFAALKAAADARRRLLSYRVSEDMSTLSDIARHFDADYCRKPSAPRRVPHTPLIFIVGLPRSGTTLVDRILSSHSQVRSRGESSDLAAAVMQLAGTVTDKSALIKNAAAIDPTEIARNYCARLPPMSETILIDKTPMNFLYIGLIAKGFPDARIVHVRRQPFDVCYAMYKTLFRMAYPFSYSLEDLANYYASYAKLMQHWRALLGNQLIEVDYENLVNDQEHASRQLLQACGLPWEDACMEFYRNVSPTLTASAAQVREPIYNSSVGMWRRYESELQPLILKLSGLSVQ